MDVEKENVIKNKNEAIKMLNNYLDTCISIDSKHLKKANLISYWLKDYIRYIENEETFSCEKLKKYSRGDIIKVNLGFNIGNEEGGLHYCVVLDVINAKKYSTLTVVPLTSQKNNKNIPNSAILLGTEIYDKLSKKYMCEYDEAGSIGKRYRREDEIGTPYCITVDFETEKDNSNDETLQNNNDKRDENDEICKLYYRITDEGSINIAIVLSNGNVFFG